MTAGRISPSLKALVARRTMARLSFSSRPSLAIIDDYLNTSAPHFKHIPSEKLQITTFNDTLVPADDAQVARLVERLKPFDLISTVRERTAFPGSLLRQLPNLKLLLATGTQFEMFDLAAARELGITVVAAPGLGRTDQLISNPPRPNIKKGGAHPTTQHTWALILALARNIAIDDVAIKTGGWQSGLAMGLTGLTLGIVGLGRLGAAVARIGHLAWAMRVVCWSENLTQQKADQMAEAVGLAPNEGIQGDKTFRVVSKEELFSQADVVSIHYVLSSRSQGIVGAKELGLMKRDALLVNASRGPLIDQVELIDALEHRRIRGAALDVFDIEPLPQGSLWRRDHYWGQDGRACLLTTPHMGYVDEGLMNTWYAETAENVERVLEGKEVLHRLA
ncbi:hypothetical protein VE01_05342 [Pseudogymnoascus verrucosus]|uniref:D-isomer specific 2-hydroxyacid dehydrogenase NAD-binding domain-containing protein n=1 Tax=Pseudogymnoascus verrucosus TaxID=342668 RepID=A0A1B8GLB4_9PEZI|nr:uncharacterized protein VE01_05342 [Pseudogymnoascus verrucosus]OBT96586.2 hypothetical protein VE01_05342 [Pseudogymnoascus verrucosus]